jgi:hypothetical protein
MVAKKAKSVYRTDQREMSVFIYADSEGHTRAVVTWRECLAGEETKREWEVKRVRWPGAINTKEHALWCLVQLAKSFTVVRNPGEE